MTNHPLSMFERIGGAPTFDRLVDLFYARMSDLPEAHAIRAMHPQELEPIKRVLKNHLGEWTGGPKNYSSERGHPRLRQRHIGFKIGAAERDAWLLCMRGALGETIADSGCAEELYAGMAKLADWMRNDPGNPHDSRAAGH